MIIMGRIKSTPVKKLGDEILQEAPDKFGLDFTKNKAIIKEMKEIKSKKMLNLVAGYITNEVKKREKLKEIEKRKSEAKKKRAQK